MLFAGDVTASRVRLRYRKWGENPKHTISRVFRQSSSLNFVNCFDAADTTDDGAGDSMWQNQQNERTQREDSDQPGRSPRLIRVFAVHSVANEASKFISPGQCRL